MTPGLNPYTGAARRFKPTARRDSSPLALSRRLDPRTRTSPALNLIDRSLVALADHQGTHDSVAIFIAPQEGKSTLVSRRYPEWLLEHDPALRVAIVSYEFETAVRWGRDIRRDIDMADGDLPISLRADNRAAGRWETPQGGGVYCVGVGGPLTGRAVDVLLVDDPVKDRADAESARMRDRAWEWWESVALTRLAPGAIICLIQTRWHQDDLAGRILTRPSARRWETIRIPAIAEADDPLGRAPGQELLSARDREPGYFTALRATMSPYVFSGIYQQNPAAAEGNFFRRAAFRYWRTLETWSGGGRRLDLEGRTVTLSDCWRFGTVDVAASTKTSADYTVVSMWAVSPEGDLILLDRRRAQVAQHDHFALAQPLFERWGECQLFVEHGFFGSTLVTDAREAGLPVAEVVADKDKVTRAVPAAARVHSGRVWFPAKTSGCPCGNCPQGVLQDGEQVDGVWLDEWCDELASFPSGDHDDQVDTLSYAARVQTAEWTAPTTQPSRGIDPFERAVNLAVRSATGGGEFDAMNIPY